MTKTMDFPTPELESIFRKIAARKAQQGSWLRPPCPNRKLATLKERVVSAFGVGVPEEYLDFLRRMNGLDTTAGTVFFAAEKEPRVNIEGFVEANAVRRKNARVPHLLIFGESGMEYYAYDIKKRTYDVIDAVALDPYESYASYDSLMVAALEKRLK